MSLFSHRDFARFACGFAAIAVVFAACAVFLGYSCDKLAEAWQNRSTPSEVNASEDSRRRIVIDAGHGGEDGGASGNGLIEKDVNLAISSSLAELCRLFGFDTVMTREDDTLLYGKFGDLDDYTGKKKTYDLRNRVRIAAEVSPEVFVSIHMNTFPSPSSRGLQVYYSTNAPESRAIAEKIGGYCRLYLDSDNRRVEKPGGNIYILKQIKTPAVLVECGFLSNPEEAEAFGDSGYRTAVAATVFAAILG